MMSQETQLVKCFKAFKIQEEAVCSVCLNWHVFVGFAKNQNKTEVNTTQNCNLESMTKLLSSSKFYEQSFSGF